MREGGGIASSDGGLDLGLGNLPSLQRVRAKLIRCEGANKEAVEQAKAALTLAARMHPNHPNHDINIWWSCSMMETVERSVVSHFF
jgi:hypothetical protein